MKSEDTAVSVAEMDHSFDCDALIQAAKLDKGVQYRRVSLLIKRAIDIIGALVGLVIFSPVFLFVTVLIKLDSPGPAVFKQERLGLNGRHFTFYKFRSMQHNCRHDLHKKYVRQLIQGQGQAPSSAKEGEETFKITDDPRVTKIGRILRRTSLDELPQLFNVLKGEMSLVGPRPAIPYEIPMYKDWYIRRLSVAPGISGLWQVSGRSERTFDEMVELDLEYVDNWSLLLDLKIIWRTISVVLKREGAW